MIMPRLVLNIYSIKFHKSMILSVKIIKLLGKNIY